MKVLREDREDIGVSVLRLNRPEARNALDLEMRLELVAELDAIEGNDAIRATVITGDERAFAAGADIALLAKAGPAEIHRLGLARLWGRIFAHPKPLLAAVNGYAFGGGFELALLCDIMVGGPGTRLGLPEIKLGIMPGGGGTQRLVRLIGRHRAMGLLLSGEPIDGETAEKWGILTELAASDAEVLPRTIERAAAIAAMPPLAVEMIKSAVTEGADLPLEAALRIEQRNMQILFDTPDQKARMDAFLQKRRR
ncbi:enoyl-CoA hydratase/carnithine racemase [Palleronia aestuarii]|uniref:Enoyl-CoA hydratase/carnithine racemase n=2 Tax=Palleronia aestuarii TaxID=568105 RepID=A0A2W7PZZ7_9RHOB|nr:enoyl-CoA hydratase/carnithine racemase [Palleronia aestuarii]